ncbi:hypothetical protein D9M68_860160 [compost metagenome]
MTDFPLQQEIVVLVEEREMAVFAGNQGEICFQQCFRYIQLEDFQFFTAPAIAVQAEPRCGYFSSGFR